MKSLTYLLAFAVVSCFLSCKKDASDPVQPTDNPPIASQTRLADSASYTLDETTYTCDLINGEGGGNAGTNLDTANNGWKWHTDTIQYTRSFNFGVSSAFKGGHPGRLNIVFIKKFAKEQLFPNIVPGIKAPLSDTILYNSKGQRAYAVDYLRSNNQEGIALQVDDSIAGVNTRLLSYCNQSALLPTTISNDAQKNSKFDIINFYRLPSGEHILEAKFTAKVFDRNEKSYSLEKGYVRIHVD